MAKKRLVLVDGTALIYRAFFSIPSSFSTSDGTPTNASYGFALMFRKLLAGKTPDFGAVIFDAPGRTFRDDRFSEYKAQRPPMRGEMRVQIPWIHRIVEAHGYPLMSVPGYEADDVIGTLTKAGREAGHEVFIISGDKDFVQLIDDDVRMVDTVKDVTYDAELVRKKWGVTPARFTDYLALVGDTADNVPGIRGIGPKTAKKLLATYGDLEGVLAAADELKGKQRERLIEFADAGRLSKELVTIDCAVPLELGVDDLALEPAANAPIDALYRELEFYSLLSGDDAAAAADAREVHVVDIAGAADFVGAAAAPVAVLPIYDGAPMDGTLVGAALSGPDPSKVAYLPLSDSGARGWFLDWCESEAPKVGHDVRDLHCFVLREGRRLHGLVGDSRLASFLIDPTRDIPHRLDQLCRAWLHRTLPELKSLVGSGKKRRSLAELDHVDVAAHAGELVAALAECWPLIESALADEGQETNLQDVSLPMAEVLARMQLSGVIVDVHRLDSLAGEFEARKAEIEAEVAELAGRSFNLGSTKQLGQVLFDELGLPVIKRTKTGYSTAADVLERLANEHPIAQRVIDWRALAKLINTYTRVLREAAGEDGRVRCTFQQTAGASGRLITTNPDIQRTPIRTGDGKRIREAFLPREGWNMVSADWSQIELRILAHMTGDAALVEAYQRGDDIHRRTAAAIYSITEAEVTPAQRNVGKTINFATIYGQGATALGQSLGIPRAEAKATIERYFAAFSGVRRWLDDTVKRAYDDGFVETILGRRRYIPELQSNNFSDRGYGERIATNTPIQGSGADLCKLAMIRIDARLQSMEACMLLQIHDELVFEAPPSETDALVRLVKHEMEHAYPLRVPLVVDVGVGASWSEAH
ncbi:MAG: DNA polymerase I [Myxococcota bacterium]